MFYSPNLSQIVYGVTALDCTMIGNLFHKRYLQ